MLDLFEGQSNFVENNKERNMTHNLNLEQYMTHNNRNKGFGVRRSDLQNLNFELEEQF